MSGLRHHTSESPMKRRWARVEKEGTAVVLEVGFWVTYQMCLTETAASG